METDTEQERAFRLAGEGLEAMNAGENETARRLLHECMSIRQELGDQSGVAKALNNLANVDAQEGNEEGAKALWQQSLEIQRGLNNLRGMHCPLANLSGAAHRAGDYALMRDLEEQIVAVARELGDRDYLAHSLDSLMQTAMIQEDYAYARHLQQESLTIKRQLDLRDSLPNSLNLCADLAFAMQDFERSALFSGAYATQRALLERPQHPREKEELASRLTDLESHFGEAPCRSAYSTGKLLTLEQATDAAAEFCATPLPHAIMDSSFASRQ